VEQISAAVVQQMVYGHQAVDWITSALLALWPIFFQKRPYSAPSNLQRQKSYGNIIPECVCICTEKLSFLHQRRMFN